MSLPSPNAGSVSPATPVTPVATSGGGVGTPLAPTSIRSVSWLCGQAALLGYAKPLGSQVRDLEKGRQSASASCDRSPPPYSECHLQASLKLSATKSSKIVAKSSIRFSAKEMGKAIASDQSTWDQP